VRDPSRGPSGFTIALKFIVIYLQLEITDQRNKVAHLKPLAILFDVKIVVRIMLEYPFGFR
jgi:hypothetical protein